MTTSIQSPSCASKHLSFLGKGTYGTEIHFLEIKFYDISVYAEEELGSHLKAWVGQPKDALLAEDSGFFTSLCEAPVEKVVKFDIIKEVKGSQFGTPLQAAVRDKLASEDQYEDEEEEVLEKVVEFFHKKKPWLAKHTTIYFHWPSSNTCMNIYVVDPCDSTTSQVDHESITKGESYTVENEKVAHHVLDWIVGPNSFSTSLLDSIASNESLFRRI